MQKKLTPEEYQKIADRKSPASKLGLNCIKAFCIGGLICTLGQAFFNFYQWRGLDQELAGTATSISLVFLSVLLTALNIYPKIAKHGGAGTLVPITGFANAMSAPAIEAQTEGAVLGVGVKLFTIAGPVIVYGVVASMVAGVLFWIFNL